MPSLLMLRRLVLDRWLFDWRQRGVDRLPRPELEALQERRLRSLLTYVVERSPFYARLYRGIDVARAPLTELPTVDKPTLMESWDDVVTDGRLRRAQVEAFVSSPANVGRYYRGRYFPMLTSGTTGTRGLFVYSGVDGLWRGFAGRRAARMQRHRPTGRRAEIISHVASSNGYWARRAMPSWNPWTRSFDLLAPTAQLVAALNDYQPDSLTGFARYLEILAREQLEGRLRIAPHTMFSRVEPLTPEARAAMEQAWGAPVRDCYVTAEVGAIAAQCTAGELMHVFEDLVILETVPGSGDSEQEGDPLLVTSLTARTFPIIRYWVGDRAELMEEPCLCGRTFRRLRGVYGREYWPLYFQRPDGSWMPLHYLPFEHLIGHWPQVRRFQVRHEPTGMTVLVVPETGAQLDTSEMERQVRHLLMTHGAVPPPLTVLTVDEAELRRRSGGKYVSFVALVEPPGRKGSC